MNPMMQMGGSPMPMQQGGMSSMMGGMGQGMPIPPPQPPTPEQMALLDKPSWEQVISLLHDNVHRSYRIDIETDSTIAGSLESDMHGLGEVMQAVSGFMQQAQPLIVSGMMPMEAAKAILMTITRRARMGNAVEDALDKMVQPKPQQPAPDPRIQVADMQLKADAQKFQAEQQAEQQKLAMQAQAEQQSKQFDMQLEQQRIDMEARAEQVRADNEIRIAQAEQAFQAQQDTQRQQLEAERDRMEMANTEQLERMKAAIAQRDAERDAQLQLIIAQMNNATKIEVAEIGKQGGLLGAEQTAAAEFAADDAGVD